MLSVALVFATPAAMPISFAQGTRHEWIQWNSPEDAGFDSAALEAVRLHADEAQAAAAEELALRSIDLLEPAGLTPGRVEELRTVNASMRAAQGQPGQLIRLDAEWHETLLAPCPNTHALEMIASLRRRVQRYEYTFMQVERAANRSPFEHDEILDLLLCDDIEAAVRILVHQWTDAVGPVLGSIREQNERATSPRSRS